MKLSIAWIFDHIDADWKTVDIQQLVHRFNQTVAEIEHFQKVHLNLDLFTMVDVTRVDTDAVVVFSLEWDQEYKLPMRKGVVVGQQFLIKKDDTSIAWANAQDLGSGKDMLMPALRADNNWKQTFETHDYILEVDNKSITHRPDMWGHRGFAREVAALLDLPFKSPDKFLSQQHVAQSASTYDATATNPFMVTIKAPGACKRIAGIYVDNVQMQPSSLSIAHRLARVDARAIDGIVDITNYVMLEWGQPMHAFDAKAFGQKQLIPRMAKNKERLTLLDGEAVELTEHDLVISDGDTPLALAGVMGGASSGINGATTAMIVESVALDATTIRKTADRYKKRTEASARFEKSLDPQQNVAAIIRFITLLHQEGIQAHLSDEIFSVGQVFEPTTITIAHETIQTRLGVTIAHEFVRNTLTKLGFGVTLHDEVYTIVVPTFRGTKDVKIKEDIIEEVGRYYGYTTLEPQFPLLALRPSQDLDWIYQQRKIKQTLAYSCAMQELYTYAFFDEEFLQQLNWQPHSTLEVQNPVSANWRRLVTTLVPNLLKSVVTNSADHDQLRFFESARTWTCANAVDEQKSLAGIFYDKKRVDFYDAKAELQKLFDLLKLSVTWVPVQKPDYPWYAPYQTADLMHNGTKIGTAGSLHPTFLSSLCPGDAFIFELNADFLMNYKRADMHVVAANKYPEMVRDISMLIGLDITVDTLQSMIKHVDTKIVQVSLLDFFHKDEWPDKKAMTFRFVIADHERTMTKEQADTIWDAVAHTLKNVGATIR